MLPRCLACLRLSPFHAVWRRGGKIIPKSKIVMKKDACNLVMRLCDAAWVGKCFKQEVHYSLVFGASQLRRQIGQVTSCLAGGLCQWNQWNMSSTKFILLSHVIYLLHLLSFVSKIVANVIRRNPTQPEIITYGILSRLKSEEVRKHYVLHKLFSLTYDMH